MQEKISSEYTIAEYLDYDHRSDIRNEGDAYFTLRQL